MEENSINSTLKKESIDIPGKPENSGTSSHPKSKFMSKKPTMFFLGFIFTAFIFSFIAGGLYLGKNQMNKDVACTEEAKICPDGVTSVGRSGPKCEFTPCPNPESDNTSDWNTYSNKEIGYSIHYPDSLEENCQDTYVCGFHPKEENPNDNNFFRVLNITKAPDFDPKSKQKILEEMKMRVGEKKNFDGTNFERLPDKTVAGITATIITNSHEEGMTRKAYLFYKDNELYLIDGFYGTTNLTEDNFDQIVSTFKFTP